MLLKPKRLSALATFLLITFLVLGQILFLPSQKQALADELLNRSLEVFNPLPSAVSNYQFSFDTPTSGTVGSILFQFCSNSPTFGLDCTAPNGFSASQATLQSQSGISGFTIQSGMPANEILLARSPSVANAQANSYMFSSIVNTSDLGQSFVRVSTYATTDASGPDTDDGGIAYAITNALDISTEVPQFLEFCTGVNIFGFTCSGATGDSIDFGTFTSSTTSDATSQFLAATNAGSGYNVLINATTLTSGNNTIAASSGSPAVAGTSQFGFNLVANNSPSVGSDPQGPGSSTPDPAYAQPDIFRFNNGDILATATNPDNYHKFTVSYVVNISKNQAPGDYAATMYFICLANF